MALTETQTKSLKAKLKRRTSRSVSSAVLRCRTSKVGMPLPRPIGSSALTVGTGRRWRRAVIGRICRYGETVCFYSTKVRITVRAGDTVTVREGIGTGFGRAPQPELAHDIALKAAETDATKRALATFGNPFGLALYDRDQAQVTKPRRRIQTERTPSEQAVVPLVLELERRTEDGSLATPEFCRRHFERGRTTAAIDGIYAFWSSNLAALTELRRRTDGAETNAVDGIIAALKDGTLRRADPAAAARKDQCRNHGP